MLHSASCGLQATRFAPNRLLRGTESSPQVITEQTSIHWTEYRRPREYKCGCRMDRSSQAKIKAVILDYGEVLSYPPTAQAWSRMANLFHMDPGRFRSLWGRNRLAYDRGDLSLEAYWSQLAEDAGMNLEPEILTKLSQWDNEMWARVNPPMVEWPKRMRSAGVKTGLLSNMPVCMIRYARQQFGWLTHFDHQTF